MIAPPYDVLSAEDKAALIAQHDRNIVGVDLPHVPPKTAGPDEVYTQAAATLNAWMADGTLIHDGKPALYVYHQEYTHAGQQYVRKKFFARMRLEPFGQGTVFPHEQTFGGPKEDRMKLMRATRCQLSAVFGLYSDPDNRVSDLLDCSGRSPDMIAEQEGVTNRLWLVHDRPAVEAVSQALRDRAVYIADGHHRYGTALMYRDNLLAQKSLPYNHAANYVLIGLCAMEDPGAVILPTHRVISGFGDVPAATILQALRAGLDLQEISSPPADPEELLPASSADDQVLYDAAENKLYRARFTRRDDLRRLEPAKSDAWRQLDVAYVQRYLIGALVSEGAMHGQSPAVQYIKSVGEAIEQARQNQGIALVGKACTMAQLKAVSDAGDLMPQKSTYFYPKLATGLVINPLED